MASVLLLRSLFLLRGFKFKSGRTDLFWLWRWLWLLLAFFLLFFWYWLCFLLNFFNWGLLNLFLWAFFFLFYWSWFFFHDFFLSFFYCFFLHHRFHFLKRGCISLLLSLLFLLFLLFRFLLLFIYFLLFVYLRRVNFGCNFFWLKFVGFWLLLFCGLHNLEIFVIYFSFVFFLLSWLGSFLFFRFRWSFCLCFMNRLCRSSSENAKTFVLFLNHVISSGCAIMLPIWMPCVACREFLFDRLRIEIYWIWTFFEEVLRSSIEFCSEEGWWFFKFYEIAKENLCVVATSFLPTDYD